MQDGGFSDGVKKNFTGEDFRFTAKDDTLFAIALKVNDTSESASVMASTRKARVDSYTSVLATMRCSSAALRAGRRPTMISGMRSPSKSATSLSTPTSSRPDAVFS